MRNELKTASLTKPFMDNVTPICNGHYYKQGNNQHVPTAVTLFMTFPYLRGRWTERTVCQLSKYNSSHGCELLLMLRYHSCIGILPQNTLNQFSLPDLTAWHRCSGTARWNSFESSNLKRCKFIKAGWPLMLLLLFLSGIVLQWFSSLFCKPPFSFHLPKLCIHL